MACRFGLILAALTIVLVVIGLLFPALSLILGAVRGQLHAMRHLSGLRQTGTDQIVHRGFIGECMTVNIALEFHKPISMEVILSFRRPRALVTWKAGIQFWRETCGVVETNCSLSCHHVKSVGYFPVNITLSERRVTGFQRDSSGGYDVRQMSEDFSARRTCHLGLTSSVRKVEGIVS
jgi:hypothetical protein